ncbi:MAG: translation elongation factor Ts [Omnitrophica WOR_2 bacterium RIFCSPLOWO2_01_FULL_41_12]|nr:MAG: translation elongation factor Ts [Omnitrophica WOR_2 bacterium RIFCSPLOWO2_01_FULL_41_12]
MKVSLETVKELRKLSSASVSDCKKALEETGGDIPRAQELLRKRGLEIAAKKQDRIAKEGRIEAYVHLGNKIGVLLEVNCESDFVARNSDFAQFTKDVAMQIAACNPLYIKKEDVPNSVLEKEENQGLFLKEKCLLEQAFIKDPNITIRDYLGSLIAKIGENIIIRRFIRYKVGD